MSEGTKISKPLVDAINAIPGGKAIKQHGTAYTEAGDPDILAVVRSTAYRFESKEPGKKPTPIQRKRLREWAEAGAIVGIVYSKEEGLAIIDGDEEVRARCFARIWE